MDELTVAKIDRQRLSVDGSYWSQMTPKPHGDGITYFSVDRGKTWTTQRPLDPPPPLRIR